MGYWRCFRNGGDMESDVMTNNLCYSDCIKMCFGTDLAYMINEYQTFA
jgi:hypothetical protein